eukprot:5571559-Pleurochrysis_carterae.AAC.3
MSTTATSWPRAKPLGSEVSRSICSAEAPCFAMITLCLPPSGCTPLLPLNTVPLRLSIVLCSCATSPANGMFIEKTGSSTIPAWFLLPHEAGVAALPAVRLVSASGVEAALFGTTCTDLHSILARESLPRVTSTWLPTRSVALAGRSAERWK